MSKTLKEILSEEFLTCNICYDEFHNPKVLACLHTFCAECILRTIDRQTGRTEVSCPICRARIEPDLNGEFNLQTNFQMKNLLEMSKDLPSNEVFTMLCKVQAELNLDMSQAISIAERNQCVYLQANVDELRLCVVELRQQINKQQKDLEAERTKTKNLSKQLAEKDSTIADLVEGCKDLMLIIQERKSDLKGTDQELAKPSPVMQKWYQITGLWDSLTRLFKLR